MISTIAVIAGSLRKKKTSAIIAIIWNHSPAIVAIIWKPGLIYRNNYPPFLLNCYLYALQTYRKHSPKLWLLLVSWLNSHQKIISIQTPQRDPVHKIYKVFLQIDQKYTHLSGWYLWLQKGHTSVDVYSHFKLE